MYTHDCNILYRCTWYSCFFYFSHFRRRAKRALVFLGAHEIKNANEMGQVRIMVKRNSFIIYPSWNPRRLKDDIALVRLPVPIEFNGKYL